MARQRYQGAPWLYDETTGDIVGVNGCGIDADTGARKHGLGDGIAFGFGA